MTLDPITARTRCKVMPMRALLTALKSLREEERLARALQKELRGMAGKVTGKEGGGGGGGGEEEEEQEEPEEEEEEEEDYRWLPDSFATATSARCHRCVYEQQGGRQVSDMRGFVICY